MKTITFVPAVLLFILIAPTACSPKVQKEMKKSKDKTSVMYGKSILIKGTIGDIPFEFASDKSFDFEEDVPAPGLLLMVGAFAAVSWLRGRRSPKRPDGCESR